VILMVLGSKNGHQLGYSWIWVLIFTFGVLVFAFGMLVVASEVLVFAFRGVMIVFGFEMLNFGSLLCVGSRFCI